MTKKKSKRIKGINVTVSVEAHQIMSGKALKAKPRLNLRQYVNIINNLPSEA